MHYPRESILQEAASKNQDFQSTSHSLKSFLDNLPQNTINLNDDLSQVTAKEKSQEVRLWFIDTYFPFSPCKSVNSAVHKGCII